MSTKPTVAPLSRRQAAGYAVGMPLVFGALLFLPAGTFGWPLGWLFFAVMMTAMLAAVIWLARVNPEIFGARSRIQPGTKGWDRVVTALLIPLFAAILPVAALDTVRLGGTVAPPWIVVLGYLLFAGGFIVTAWAQAVNRFFEPGVRIQSDRGQHVVDNGPYAIVRHPGYAAAAPLMVGMALALGSWWALAPAAAAVLLLAVRTAWEDRTLHAELPGYSDYARRVRWRLVPGLW